MIVIGIIFMIIVVVSMAAFLGEVKKAPLIDDKVPFLWDDYDPKKDKSTEEYHFVTTFCENCKFFDGTAMCLHEDNLGEIVRHRIKYCKEKSMFEAV